MIRRVTFLTAVALLIGVPLVWGQGTHVEETMVHQITDWGSALLPQDGLGMANSSTLQQFGTGNQAFIQQTHAGSGSGPNIANIVQDGSSNQSELTQEGSNIRSIGRQIGNDNTSSIRAHGDDLSTVALQEDNGNQILQELWGSGFSLEVRQTGDANQLTQIETGGVYRAYRIQQQGDAARLVIVNGPVPLGSVPVLLQRLNR